jgi:hypothetical protein
MNGARPAAKLVNGSAHFPGAEGDDDPLDLPPVAEKDDIAQIPAPLGANGRFEPGIVAEALDQFGGVGKRRPSGDERGIHRFALTAQLLPDWRQMSSTPR